MIRSLTAVALVAALCALVTPTVVADTAKAADDPSCFGHYLIKISPTKSMIDICSILIARNHVADQKLARAHARRARYYAQLRRYAEAAADYAAAARISEKADRDRVHYYRAKRDFMLRQRRSHP